MKIEYNYSFVAFLDVLGFKNLVFNKENEKIGNYFSVIEEVINQLRTDIEKTNIQNIIFSDSIIISLSCSQDENKKDKLHKLREFCIAIGKIQQRLATENIWLRGAVTYGEVYFTSHQIVGPAYIKAYQLEEENAINPRVILDSSLISCMDFNSAKDLITAINKSNTGKSDWGERILFDWGEPFNSYKKIFIEQDVPLFIDYLYPIISKKEDMDSILKNIGDSIYNDMKIYSKYKWVANYILSISTDQIGSALINVHEYEKLKKI